MTSKATRYCGSLRIVIQLQDDFSYKAVLYGPRMLCGLEGLNLSPFKQSKIAADSKEAFSLIAASAISFASHDNPQISDEIYSLCDIKSNGEPVISTKRR